MDDQIMNTSKITMNDNPTNFIEIDTSNHTWMAEWIKMKLQELDGILVEHISNKNSE